MKYIPILFSTPMVQAILEDRKIVTRRVINPQPQLYGNTARWGKFMSSGPARITDLEHLNLFLNDKSKYGKPGDVLWVRETFFHSINMGYIYKADGHHSKGTTGVRLQYSPEWVKWKPSLFMPKDACRIFLKVTDVKVERLQDITEAEAKAEGVQVADCCHAYYHGFSLLWQKINGKESWEANPWAWCISFEKIEKPAGFLQLP